MQPVLGRFGPFLIHSYTLVMGLGLAAVVLLTKRLAAGDRPGSAGWRDALAWTALAALAGGRIGYVAANWTYFQQAAGEIALLWLGGLSYHGALAGGAAGLWAWARRQGRSAGRYAGLFAPGLALLSAFGWAACYLEGCASGRPAPFGPLAAGLPDAYGIEALRYQTQALGLLLALPALALALWGRGRWPGKVLFWVTLLALSAGRLAVAPLRGDPVPLLADARLDVYLEAGLSLLAAGMALKGGPGNWQRRSG
ncbi:MAG: prolipoprotein diacylglyceryl transferase family protein [Candidatus Promineifilaceae bacterium]